ASANATTRTDGYEEIHRRFIQPDLPGQPETAQIVFLSHGSERPLGLWGGRQVPRPMVGP
ncbi:MAG: hypothetical protein QOF70_840, partial [Acetobacteraceae bacterium]|nr:hypothetical protein [Acetobacteraceae bacterium]